MMLLALVVRVFFWWVVLSLTLGLCWIVACLAAPLCLRWYERNTGVARQLKPLLPLPDVDAVACGVRLTGRFGFRVLPRPRRFGQRLRPMREPLARPTSARNNTSRSA